MSTNSNNLKEEIIEIGKAEVPPPSSPDSSHIVTIGQNVTTTTTAASSPIDPSKGGKKGKNSKKSKNKDGSDKEEKEPVAKISYFQLYRFASTWDWFCVM